MILGDPFLVPLCEHNVKTRIIMLEEMLYPFLSLSYGQVRKTKRSAEAKGLTNQIVENKKWRPETTLETGRNNQAK